MEKPFEFRRLCEMGAVTCAILKAVGKENLSDNLSRLMGDTQPYADFPRADIQQHGDSATEQETERVERRTSIDALR